MGVSILSGTVEGREAAVFVSRTTGTTFGPVMEDEATALAFSEYLAEDPRKIAPDKLMEAYHAFFKMLRETIGANADDPEHEIRFRSIPHVSTGGEPEIDTEGRWMVYDQSLLEPVCEYLPSEQAMAIATVLNADPDRRDAYAGKTWSASYGELR